MNRYLVLENGKVLKGTAFGADREVTAEIVFTTAMTYEILLIVVIGGIGSISGSCIAAFLYVAASEWWLRFLDTETYIGSFKVPFLRTGFRMVVFSVIIMVVVLFFRKGLMGDKELPDLLKRRKKVGKGAARS